MDEIIAALDRYFLFARAQFCWKHAGVLEYSSAREILGQWRRRSSAGISSGAKDECCRACFPRFAAQTLATTVKRLGAVSSVVERLVYTDTHLIFSFYPTCSDVLNAR